MEQFAPLGFVKFHNVAGRLSIADLYPKSHSRCGIYMLIFSDSLVYIGKAVDVVRRFAQHRKNHIDIIQLSFQSVSANNLDTVEQRLIKQAESIGFKLTNKAHVSHIIGETDLDTILSPTEQDLWLANPSIEFSTDIPVNDDNQRIRYQRNFQRLQANPEFANITSLLKTYVHQCIPAPQRTVYSFWNISCLPSTNSQTFPRYAAISMHTMETFVLCYDKKHPDSLLAFINISKSIFDKKYKRIKDFYRKHPFIFIQESNYETAGVDQIQIHTSTFAQTSYLLRNPTILEAARLMNLRLMRKGATLFSKYHCFDLSDHILST